MTIDEKINQLRQLIYQQISPLIQSDYVLWGLPYHENVGDTLIWQGELEFLKNIPHRCLGTCGWNRLSSTQPLPAGTTILLHGGGFLGDVWRDAWNNMLTHLTAYAHHPIVLLPNTLYYADQNLLQLDAQRMKVFNQLTICLRDKRSFHLAQSHFSNPTLLVPDMAFCIPPTSLRKRVNTPPTRHTLLLQRADKEAKHISPLLTSNIELHDWPTVGEAVQWQDHLFEWVQRATSCTSRRAHLIYPLMQRVEAALALHLYRPYLIRSGVNLMSPYQHIITTRLHGLILSMLLNKPVAYIDNSYGKLSTFYNTWLTDVDSVAPWHQPST